MRCPGACPRCAELAAQATTTNEEAIRRRERALMQRTAPGPTTLKPAEANEPDGEVRAREAL
jgi:hypothetical protein